MRHAATVDVVGEVVDGVQACTHRLPVHPGQVDEVNVVDGQRIAVAVDEIDDGTANAPQRRQTQFHGPVANFHGFGATFYSQRIGLGGVPYPPPHATGGRPVLGGEVVGRAAWLVVDDEVDAPLSPKMNRF